MSRKPCLPLLALFLAAVLLLAGCKPPPQDSPPQEPPALEETKTGEEGEGEEEQTLEPPSYRRVAPALVVIDNNSRAVPQSGLQAATRVYEFLVEGGISRFLALFDTLPEETVVIGPIRSLRPYLAQQATEHGGAVAHSGYSKATREKIQGLPLKHINSSTYLYRDSSRKSPHNLYTDTDKLYAAAGYKGTYTEATPRPSQLPPGFEAGREVNVEYSRTNRVTYTYDEESQTYLRFINGNPHTDRDSDLQYSARRVILRRTPHAPIPDTKLVEINLAGKGNGYLYEEGRRYAISWVRQGGVTAFYYQDGSPVDLSYGSTWIQVVRGQ